MPLLIQLWYKILKKVEINYFHVNIVSINVCLWSLLTGCLLAESKCHFTIGIWAYSVPMSQIQRKVLWEHLWYLIGHPMSQYPSVLVLGVFFLNGLRGWSCWSGSMADYWVAWYLVDAQLLSMGYGLFRSYWVLELSCGVILFLIIARVDFWWGCLTKVNCWQPAWQKGNSSLGSPCVNGEVGPCAPL